MTDDQAFSRKVANDLTDMGFGIDDPVVGHAATHEAGGADELSHSNLPDLTADDHKHYILADGTRPFSDYLDVETNGIPASPPLGTVRLYAVDDQGHERIEHQDSDGTRHRMGRDVTIVAKNTAGAQVDKGEMVYINGSVGASGSATVDFAQADNDATANSVFVAMEDVANNAFGSFMKIGEILQLNTDVVGWNEGDPLFLDTAVAGGLTNVEPVTPYPVVFVGTLIAKHAVNGSIQFNIGTRINPYKPGLLPTPASTVALTADVDNLVLLVGTLPDVQIYIDPDADGWVINSIVSDAKTRQLWLTNVDATFGFDLADEGTGTAANRIITSTGADLTIPALSTALVVYDVANSRWRVEAVLNVSGGSGITQLTGDVTAGPGSGSQAATIANNAVTNAKAADMAANTIKGNNTAGLADPVDIAVGTNTVLGRVAGNIVAATVVTDQIADSNVTLAKIQDAIANSKLLGSGDAGSGNPYAELTLGTGLSMSGTTLNGTAGPLSTASTTEVLTGTDSAKAVTPDALAALWEQGSNIASAGVISVGEGGFFHVTGTTTITDIDFATDKAGRKAWIRFAGVLTLTHNATTLILPSGANITTAADDTACFVSEGSDNVRCVAYQRADGTALVDADTGITELTGDVTAGPGSGSQAATIPADTVTNAQLANMAGFTAKVKSDTGAGDPEDLAVGTNTVLGRVAGDIVAAQLATGQVADNAISDAKLRDSAGFSVIGKATTGSGDPADITVAADRLVGRSGSGDVDDVQVVTNHITDSNVTLAKIQDAVANSRLLGSGSAGAASPYSELTLGTGLSMSGTTLNGTLGPLDTASTTEVLTGTDAAKAVTPNALAAIWEQGSNVASAATISFGEGGFFHITGTVTITDIDFGTDKAGRLVWARFAGALTLTHNATSLILPTGANITTAANDIACFVSEGSDNVRCLAYMKADGTALVDADTGITQLTGDVTAGPGSGSQAATIANNAVTNAKAADMAGFTVKAKPDTGSGDPSDLSVGTNTVVGRVAGDVVAGQVQTGQVADNAITDAKLRDSAGFSVIGKAATGSGNPADIAVAADRLVGRVASGDVDDVQVVTNHITDGNVTLAKIQDAVANSKLLGSGSAGAASPYAELTLGTGLSMSGTTLNGTLGPLDTASTTEVLTGTDSAKAVTPNALAALWEKGGDIASAGTISVGEGGYFDVTGTTTITDIDFATDKTGRLAWLKFEGVLTLTHNASTLILPGGANITTAVGDIACFVSDGAADAVRCVAYTKADGTAIVDADTGITQLTGDVTAGPGSGSQAATIAADVVSNTELANMAGFTVKAKPDTGSGDPSDLSVGTNTVVGRVAGDIVAAQLATGQVADNAITDGKLRDSAGFSVIGKATTGSGDPADIAVAADRLVGRVASGDVDDVQVVTNHITDGNVTLAKIQDAVANSKLLGSGDAGSGNPYAELTLGTGLSMSGTTLNGTLGPLDTASTTEVLTGTDSAKAVTPDALAALWEQGSNVASAATISLGEGGFFHVTGTVTITDVDFATDKAGRVGWVRFAGALTLTHNATSLILPGGANITTAANDCACFVSEGSDNVRCIAYTKADGTAIVDADTGITQLTGDVTAGPGSGSQAATIPADTVANTQLANMAGFTVKAKPDTGSGDPTDMVVGTNTVLGRVAGDVVAAQLATGQIADNAVTDDKIRDSAGFSVIGKATTGSGGPADITVAADRLVGRSGSGDVDDVQVVTNHITDANVTLAKIANAANNSRLLGSGDAGSGNPYAELVLGTGLSMSGTTLNGTLGPLDLASTTEVLTGTDTAKAVTPNALAALWEKGGDIASGATISIGEGGYFDVTGTTGITDIDFGVDKTGRAAWLKFEGILTITHNASTLILPGGANITTAVGDMALFVSDGAADAVRCLVYQKASGLAVVESINDVTASSPISATAGPAVAISLDTDGVDNTYLSNMAANTIKGNDTGSSADPTDIAVGTNTVLGRVAGNIVAGQVQTGQVADNAVTNAKLADMTAYTVKVMPDATPAADPQDVAIAADRVLGRSGSGDIAGVQVVTNHVTDEAITYAKMQHPTPDRLLGNDAGTGTTDVAEITLGDGLEFDDAGGLDYLSKDFTVVSPSSVGINQDDYDPTNFGTADLLRQDIDTAIDISGFAAPAGTDRERFILVNLGTGGDSLTLKHQDPASLAANRIICPNAADLVIDQDEQAWLHYDTTSSRWRVIGVPIVVTHNSTHITGGSDEIDGDQLDIDWNPTNYTPATTPPEVSNLDHLTAHLYGIDQEFATKGTLANSDHELAPAASSGADEFDTTINISLTPVGMVEVFVNGVKYVLGDGVKTKDFYFSSDGGTTARSITSIVSGDDLIFNAATVGFDLATSDIIDIVYET